MEIAGEGGPGTLMTQATVAIPVAEIREIAPDACLACGDGPAMAKSIVEATVSAAWHGRLEVGFAHFLDYQESLRSGRINVKATPQVDAPLPAFMHSDARGGIAPLGFDLAFEHLWSSAHGASASPSSPRRTATPPVNWATTSGALRPKA
jgi:(2R)-3-sulfolactate dehydrogenase (NADP+)